MRRRTLTNTATGLATAVLLLGAAACAGGTGDRDEKDHEAVACAHGTYAWSGIVREQRLTGLADPITLTKKKDFVSGVIRPLKGVSYKPHVTSTGPGVRAADAIKALGRRLGTREPLGDPSEPAEPEKTPSHFDYDTMGLEGPYYVWHSVGLVEADFTYTCRGGAKPVRGHVVTWETVGGGFLPCGDRVTEGPSGKTDAAARAAARKLCPAGSPAAKSA
ncbi:hypothetical protein CW362_21765 [Streptomyces populi]|uniref:DUF3558 domain-containing protein n=1 Tax=Streptomyces populi TaxID=2058924 RepID=A0A2I0SLU5_9ACTN|nr:hypothetical protein [Streptomyces populi]PKT70903.1 hypothetical protein CW362_21765 [Streptomyces populi]